MRQLLFLVLIVSIGADPAVAQEDFQYEPKITALVEPYLTHGKVNAVSIGVISGGQVWKKSFGHLDAGQERSHGGAADWPAVSGVDSEERNRMEVSVG